MRRAVIVITVLSAVAGAAYGYYRYNRKDPAPTVTTARITRGDIADTVGATGQLQAVTTVQVGTQVSGTILELNADFNSLVGKGQVLARLDPSLFQTQVEQAQANLIRAEADLDRLRVSADDARTKLRRAQELAEKKLIAQTELEAAQVAVRSAEAQLRSQQAGVTQSQASLRQNQVNLEHTVIQAPIDGLVISRNVDVGQTVAASMSAPTLFLLAADLTKMQVVASLDESDVGRIRPGQPVRFRVDAYPSEEFGGTVTQVRLQPQTVQNVVTYSTVIDVPNPDLKLKPGMTANVNIEIARRGNVLRVPNTALRFRPTGEIFAALGQTPPVAPAGTGERQNGARTESRIDQPAPAAPARSNSISASPSAAGSGASRRSQAASNETASQPRREDSGGTTTGAEPGRGGVGGRGGNFQDRLASMTAEQREQMMERMRARGFSFPVDGQNRDGGPQDGGSRAGGPGVSANGIQGQPNQGEPQRSVPRNAGATTIDALFGPLPAVDTFGQVWLFGNGKLNRVRLRLGISDGQQTELIEVLDGSDLHEGTEVVSSVVTSAQRSTTAATGGNAFPGLGGRQVFPGGGFPGGGFPAGGGGR